MYIRSSTDHAGAVAAIDIGSNSVHLVVARLDKHGHLEVLDSDKVQIRLGSYLQPDGTISKKGQTLALQTISHMAEIASAYGATIRAVATHAIREAVNHAELVDTIHARTGVRIDIIDGVEEARLVFLGMRYALPLEHQLCLGMDIGGGSTELILAKGDKVQFATSLKVGAVTLSDRHFGVKNPNQTNIRKLYEYIDLRIKPLRSEIAGQPFKRAIASSGTAKALAVVHSQIFRGRVLSDENGYKFSAADLDVMVRTMEELRSPKRIKEALGIDPSRADILLAGSAIMRSVSKVFGVKEWTVTTYGLREGVVIDSFRRMGNDRRGSARDIRWEHVTALGSRWKIDDKQAERVRDLCVEIFNKLAPVLYPKGGKAEWMSDLDTLRAAAWLHEAGKFISHSSYHKHSYYLINHCRMAGFTQDERHMIGLITLYQRKGAPKFDSGELSGLRKEEYEHVVFLAGILRMATALSRSRRSVITGVRVSKRRSLRFDFRIARGVDPLVEFLQLERESEALGKAFQWNFVVDKAKHSMLGSTQRVVKSTRKKVKSRRILRHG